MAFGRFLRLVVSAMLFSAIFAPISGAAPLVRSTLDRPDEVSGFQIHLIYVVTKDGVDEQRDINGQLDTWLKESQLWLQKNLGHQLIVDTYQGQADVTFMQSKYTASELCYKSCNTLQKLAAEAKAQDPNLSATKTLYFNFSELLDPMSCGWANYFGNLSLGFSKGSTCNWAESASYTGLSQPAKTMTHELLHTFGVGHVCSDDSDLMIGIPECSINYSKFGQIPITVDASRKQYLGGDNAGIDISKLPIWKDDSGSKEYAKILPISGEKYLPRLTDGTVILKVGETSGKFDWTWSKEISTLFQEMKCTVSMRDKKVIGKSVDGACVFDIPGDWRAGSDFTITQEIVVGPYFGSASVSGKLARADYSTTPCTQKTCILNGKVEISGYCYWPEVDVIVLQKIVDGYWQNIQEVKAQVSNSCGSENPKQSTFKLTFDSVGTMIYRWMVPPSSGISKYTSAPFAILVTTEEVQEPSESEISAAQESAKKLGSEADARAEADKRAAEEKAAAEAKALEEKKAAEAKAAADAKAAEEKAAADAKAAEEKAAADKLAAEKAAEAKLAASKKTTITCVKGKISKKVTAIKPKCPAGYKKK